jgi:hypothetical protein
MVNSLEPLRIAAFFGTTFAIVVSDQLVRPGSESSQKALAMIVCKRMLVESLQKLFPFMC